jgi:hypothetical protein
LTEGLIPELATVAVSFEPDGEPIAYGVVVSPEHYGAYRVEVVNPRNGSASIVRLPKDRLRVMQVLSDPELEALRS